nr:RNA-directed DNA polymerase, eukaryota [Tanacetum cinerariifolium]
MGHCSWDVIGGTSLWWDIRGGTTKVGHQRRSEWNTKDRTLQLGRHRWYILVVGHQRRDNKSGTSKRMSFPVGCPLWAPRCAYDARSVKLDLESIDEIIDRGDGNDEIMCKRSGIINNLNDLSNIQTMEVTQKTKIRWAIEGDENSSFFHGMLNKKRRTLNVRGVLVDGSWIDNPIDVKDEFFNHLARGFEIQTPKKVISRWTFPTFCHRKTDGLPNERYWDLIHGEVTNAVRYFFTHCDIPHGCNSSFITLILKNQNAKLVKDFRPISLIGSFYKIIAKILANRLVRVIKGLINEVQSAFIAERQILDGPFILNELIQCYEVLRKFGFGDKWCKWIQCCLKSSRGSILVNGSPTKEFAFGRGFKQGDPLSSFLFILIMESLHLSFTRVVNAGLFKGISIGDGSVNLSHLFYADDAVFVGQWSDSNITTLVHGGIVDRVKKKLSKWKMKMLSIGVRLTLVKSVLGSLPIYNFSIFKVPKCVLNELEGIRRKFFNGHVQDSKKASWLNWNNVLMSKDRCGLRVSSLYAINRELLVKWGHNSCWRNIIKEVKSLSKQGIHVLNYLRIKLGDGKSSKFWCDSWSDEGVLKDMFLSVYALESCKNITIADKTSQVLVGSVRSGFRTMITLTRLRLFDNGFDDTQNDDVTIDAYTFHAQLKVESIEAYDPEAEARFVAALQFLKDLKYPLLDQLEGLKDAPIDVIMAALYLESDTGGMPHSIYATFALAPLSSPSPCIRRSDDVPVSVPTVVPQGLALLLVDAATQTDLEDT